MKLPTQMLLLRRGTGCGWIRLLLALALAWMPLASAFAQCTVNVFPATLPGASLGVPYSQTISNDGIAPSTYVVSAGFLPTGLSLDTNTGVLSGTPIRGTGIYNFDITAPDAGGCVGRRSYALAVAAPTITLTPTSLPGGTAGTPYNQTLGASGGAAPYTFAVTAGSLPTGLTLAANGVLTGSPTTAGIFIFTITATDANGFTGSAVYRPAIAAPTITLVPATLPGATAGTAYNQALGASGGAAPYTFAVTAGSLPTGLTLAANGALTGTPATNGSFNFTITATDANGYSGSQAYAFAVAGAVPQAVSKSASTLMGVPVQVDLTAGATGAPFTAANIVTVAPSGTATIAAGGTGYVMTYTPAAGFTGAATVDFTISNAFGPSAAGTVTINVGIRPNPQTDPDVLGLVITQVVLTRIFVDDQTNNIETRLQTLHDGSCGPWIGGSGRSADRDDDGSTPALDFGGMGITVGADHCINSRFTVGGGIGYGRNSMRVGVLGSRVDGHAISGMGYASYHPKSPLYIDASIGHQRIRLRQVRALTQSPNPLALVEGDREGTQDFSTFTAGYQVRRPKWRLTPYARMDVAQARLDGFSEEGDPVWALRYDDQSIATRIGTMGLRGKYTVKREWGTFEPRFRVEFLHEYHDAGDVHLQYADLASGDDYSVVPGDAGGRSSTLLEIGGVLKTRWLTFNLEYRQVFGGLFDTDRSLTLTFEDRH